MPNAAVAVIAEQATDPVSRVIVIHSERAPLFALRLTAYRTTATLHAKQKVVLLIR